MEGVGTQYNIVGATQLFPLGEILHRLDPTYGPQVWRYVKNSTGGATAIAAGEIVAHKTSATAYGQVVKSPTGSLRVRCVGVAQHAIPDAYYGFVLCKGVGSVLADTGGFSANTALVTGNAVAGRADDWAATISTEVGDADTVTDVTGQIIGWGLAATDATELGLAVIELQ